MDRLALYIAGLSFVTISGSVLIALFALDIYSVWTFVIAVGVGLITAYPVGYAISRKIKREDPFWKTRKNRNEFWTAPKVSEREI